MILSFCTCRRLRRLVIQNKKSGSEIPLFPSVFEAFLNNKFGTLVTSSLKIVFQKRITHMADIYTLTKLPAFPQQFPNGIIKFGSLCDASLMTLARNKQRR